MTGVNPEKDRLPEPSVRGYYDAFASLHDRYARASDWPAKSSLLIQRAIESVDLDIRTVLDLGAGTGFTIEAIRKYSNPEEITAVDASPGMLEILQGRYPDVKTTVAKIEDYFDQDDNKYDLITAMSALEFVPNLPNVLSNVSGHLTAKGLFAATYRGKSVSGPSEEVHHSPDIGQALREYYWETDQIEAALTSGGMEIVDRIYGLDAYKLGDETVKYNYVAASKA